jgi:quercetin dioxygenase-like cupin family protein
MTMSKTKLKLFSAGVFVACALGLIAFKTAWATPGRGVTVTTIAGPVVLDDLEVRAEADDYKLKLKTSGQSSARVVHHQIVPGGDTGWHSHPGPVFVMVTAGTLTKYEGDDPNPAVYPAGTGFVEHPGEVHIGRNEGNVDLEMISFLLTPEGESTRIDEPAPF